MLLRLLLLLLLLQLLRLRLTSRQPSSQWFDPSGQMGSPLTSDQMFDQWSKTDRGRAGPPPVGAQGRVVGGEVGGEALVDPWSNS